MAPGPRICFRQQQTRTFVSGVRSQHLTTARRFGVDLQSRSCCRVPALSPVRELSPLARAMCLPSLKVLETGVSPEPARHPLHPRALPGHRHAARGASDGVDRIAITRKFPAAPRTPITERGRNHRMTTPVLEGRGLSRKFGFVSALDEAD